MRGKTSSLSRFPVRICLLGLALWLLLIPTSVHAACSVESEKSAAKQMAKEISGVGAHKVYVPDSCDAHSTPNVRGAFFAATFSEFLAAELKGFSVVSRIDAHRFLQQNGLTDCDLARPDVISKFSSELGVDSILHLNLSFDKSSYSINFVLCDLAGKELSRFQYSEPNDGLTEALFPAAASSSGWPFYFSMHDGVTQPKAVFTPNVSSSGNKRIERISGVAIASAVVTADGRIDQIRIVQKLDPDADNAVLETMKTWRFVAAKTADGSPVPVRISIQLSLRANNK